MKKKVVIFSGAGVSKESGIDTFRDVEDGLWENFKIEDVATPAGWRKDCSKVLDFYNARRRQMPTVEPNDAHIALASLEEEYDVTIVTQNVDDLHERAGSTKILHLHGELTKARSSKMFLNRIDILEGKKITPIDIGYNDINLGDECPNNGGQLRPNIVWFGEMPFEVDKAYQAFRAADIVIIIGTSLQITYTISFFGEVKRDCEIIYVDPSPSKTLDFEYPELTIEYIKKSAVEGISELTKRLIVQAIGDDKNDNN